MFEPVSYTHLDVYKRQAHHLLPEMTQMFIIGFAVDQQVVQIVEYELKFYILKH